jgi:glycine dehydrogenase
MVTFESVVSNAHPFVNRHVGPTSAEQEHMLGTLGLKSLQELVETTVPKTILYDKSLNLGPGLSENEALKKMKHLASKNKVYRSFIGTGYYDSITPPVIQRNILENPGWYTQYTPYQAEISQGRLEALINFQTMVSDLTGLPVANASLLDEATAAAEAMSLSFQSKQQNHSNTFLVSLDVHPQTLAVLRTRAEPLGIKILVVDFFNQMSSLQKSSATLSYSAINQTEVPFGVIFQYPGTYGHVCSFDSLIARFQLQKTIVTFATDLLALTLLQSPGELGADIAVGNAQRFGVPLGFGGPHAAFFATREEHKRKIPGRIIGVSKDNSARPALRMSLQTREQHIRREKATSNICTAQVLLAVMSGMYAVYHGPQGLKSIAKRVHSLTTLLAKYLQKSDPTNIELVNSTWFDTLTFRVSTPEILEDIRRRALQRHINLRYSSNNEHTFVGVSLDEATQLEDILEIAAIISRSDDNSASEVQRQLRLTLSHPFTFSFSTDYIRKSDILSHPIFSRFQSETLMLRYIRSLESKDLSLTRSMIPLGSCTMKLNATAELIPISWPEWNQIHPHAPRDQVRGYLELFKNLEDSLAKCTGFDAVSLQPNSGAQGEYAGLLAIRKYHLSKGSLKRNICLIPRSAHGTNPASAIMAGMDVVIVECDKLGNVDFEDLKAKAFKYAPQLSALMITYPSTHGVFEDQIKEICDIIHENGGQVYMDGANLNAQVGLCRPGDFGPDVCHLNLHKTFCIPHGGGGPGMGPIAVKKHLEPFLPTHPILGDEKPHSLGTISAAAWGSASILPISMMYIWMMGDKGLKTATEVAILNANYIANRLHQHYPVLYRGKYGRVAHECIIDLRGIKTKTGIDVEDVAKRLMDYGFHAPTVSFPVAGTLMIEPTESESLVELDRFCDAMISIRQEISEIEDGTMDRENNPLKNAPHTMKDLYQNWSRPYSMEKAAFPKEWLKDSKFWPTVGRIDAAYGDRNLICTCPPLSDYKDSI